MFVHEGQFCQESVSKYNIAMMDMEDQKQSSNNRNKCQENVGKAGRKCTHHQEKMGEAGTCTHNAADCS